MAKKLSNCLGCGAVLEEGFVFCPHCGLSTKAEDKCPVCGKMIRKRGLMNHIRLMAMTDKKHAVYLKNFKS